jgi:AcrR family transcriptional regulator
MGKHDRLMKSEPTRPYRMQRRAEHVDETRVRITEAAVRLHTTIGPAHTTIARIADEAGVTRLTVYRHFADADAVFNACMGHWSAQHPGPDPAAWRAVGDLQSRARLALEQISDWYEETADDLAPIERDIDAVPHSARVRRSARVEDWIDAIVGDAPDPSGLLRAVVGHVAAAATWRSLVRDQGLAPSVAVQLQVRWVLDAADAGPV